MTLKEEITYLDRYIKTLEKQSEPVLVLRSILTRLKRSAAKAPPSPFHSEAIGLYKQWLTHHGLPAIVDARQAKALKEVLQTLKDVSKDKTDEAAMESLKVILQHWDKVGGFLGKQKQLTQISKNLLEIIDKIKNGATKQAARQVAANSFHDAIKRQYRTDDGADV